MKTILIVVALLFVFTLISVVGEIGGHASEHPSAADVMFDPPTEPVTTSTEMPTTLAPSTTSTTTVARSAPSKRLSVSSTAYCETGAMANGQPAHDGAVSSHLLPRGSRWLVLTGRFAGRVFTVEDTGPKAIFDIAMPGRCADARAYGSKLIEIEET